MLDYLVMIAVFFLPLMSVFLKFRNEFWVCVCGVFILFFYATIKEVMSSDADVDFVFFLSCVLWSLMIVFVYFIEFYLIKKFYSFFNVDNSKG